jgi:L,D-transpeptidase catalytic domain
MKIYSMVCAFSLLIVSTECFCFGSYDYSPMDYSDYYYGDDNYYGHSEGNATNDEYYTPRHKKYLNYSSHSKNKYIGGAGKTFVFDPQSLRWFAYYNGDLISTGRASGGRHYCSDIRRPCKTPVGIFRVSHKGGPECKSSKYPIGRGNAPMPWCMFFHGGFAIHGSWQVPNYNASHGCIRVPPSDARWLNQRFISSGTKVIVKGYY